MQPPDSPSLEEENARLRKRVEELESLLGNGHVTQANSFEPWEARWRSIVETAVDHVIILDRELRIQYINRIVHPLTHEEVIGSFAIDYVEPEYQRAMREGYERVLTTGEQLTIESRGQGSDNTVAWYNTRMGPLRVGEQIEGLVLFVTDTTASRVVEERWRESEHLHRTLLDKHVDGVILTIDGVVAYVNPAAQEMGGYSLHEIIGRPPRDFVTPADVPELEARIAELLNGLEESTGEFTAVRRDGTTFPVEIRTRAIRYEGKPALLSLVRDVTSRRTFEAKIQENERRWLSMLKAIPDVILVLDAQGTYRHVFTGRPELLIDSVETQTGRNIGDFLPPEVVGRGLEMIAEALRTGQVQQWEYPLMVKGRARWFSTRIVSLNSPDDPCVIWAARDITLEKSTQDALVESEARFRQLAENINQCFWLSTPDKSKMLYVSPAYERIFGETCESLYDRPRSFLDHMHPEDRERVIPRLPDQQRGRYDEEFRIIRSDGEERWCRTRAFPVHNEQGEVVRIAGFTEDISHEKAQEALLRYSQGKWESLAMTSADFIVRLDRKGIAQFINRTEPGIAREDVIGVTSHAFVLPEYHEVMDQTFAHVMETGEISSYECVGLGPNRQPHWYSVRCGPFLMGDRIEGVTLYITDISEKKAYEARILAEEQLLRKLLALQENERMLVAQDIHDGFVQDVVGAKFMLEGVRHRLKSDSREKQDLEKACSHLAAAIEEGRRLIFDLRPMVIQDEGIIEAIRVLVANPRMFGEMDILFEHQVQFDRLDPTLEGVIYRIVQEALTNTLRHAQTTVADVTLRQEGETLLLTIKDEGVGFNLEQVSPDRFGLRGIVERARLFGGEAEISTAPNAGTVVSVRLPIDPSGVVSAANSPPFPPLKQP